MKKTSHISFIYLIQQTMRWRQRWSLPTVFHLCPLSTYKILILVINWEISGVGQDGWQVAQLKAHPRMALPNNQSLS